MMCMLFASISSLVIPVPFLGVLILRFAIVRLTKLFPASIVSFITGFPLCSCLFFLFLSPSSLLKLVKGLSCEVFCPYRLYLPLFACPARPAFGGFLYFRSADSPTVLRIGLSCFVGTYREVPVMKKRVKLSRRGARRMAVKGLKTENRNIIPPPQRGGYRM